MQLHLASDPATVEVRVPPAPSNSRRHNPVLVAWSSERNAEVTLLRATARCC